MHENKHCEIDKAIFGQEYPAIHEWIDEFFPNYQDWEHWKERHHLTAIREKYKEGSNEYLSALLHIICDWISHVKAFELPTDRKETLEMLTNYCLISGDDKNVK